MAAPQPETHTFSIPGIADIIRVPALESADLKRERIQRMRASNTALPSTLNWLPSAINFLDNAEDTLIVGLTSIAVAAKYGPRIVGKYALAAAEPLGWLLLADDLINATNGLLELVAGGTPGKKNILKAFRALFGGRAAALAKGTSFLHGRVRWWGYAIQAGQVLYNWTGYGLQLGGIFGGLSDAFWGSIRAMNGEPLTVIGPPPSDPIVKAALLWSQIGVLPFITPGLAQDELARVFAGLWTGAQILGSSSEEMLADQRIGEMADTPMPVYKPWSPSSLEALADENIPVDDSMVNALPFYQRGATFADSFQAATAFGSRYDEAIAPIMGNKPGSTLANFLAQDLADLGWSAYLGPDGATKPLTPYEKMAGIAIESNVWPPWQAGTPGNCAPSIYVPTPPAPLEEPTCAHLWFIETTLCPPTVPDCTIFPDGTFVCRPTKPPTCQPGYSFADQFQIPALYPPEPGWTQGRTLAHWYYLALLLYCGAAIDLPLYSSEIGPTTQITGTVKNTKRHGLRSLYDAALLVWGNAWRKTVQPSATPTIWPQINVCARGPDGQPQLFGPHSPNANPPITAPLVP